MLKVCGDRYEEREPGTRNAPGLRVRVSPSGKKTFMVQVRLDGKVRSFTLGAFTNMPVREPAYVLGEIEPLNVAQARKKLTLLQAALLSGEDPTSAKRKARGVNGSMITVGQLVDEFEVGPGATKKSWQGPGTTAGSTVRNVFASILKKEAQLLSLDEIAKAMRDYKSKRGQGTATRNQARVNLGVVFNWASGNGKKYGKVGAHRSPILRLVDLAEIADPRADDAKVTGKREHVLNAEEIRALMTAEPTQHIRAMQWMLLTAARLNEVTTMRWGDVDLEEGLWTKPKVKATTGAARQHVLPLAEAQVAFLLALPRTHDLVFPSQGGGELGNWDRTTKALIVKLGTRPFTRHDLRRTAATLMEEMEISTVTIERVLAHVDPHRAAGAGAALKHYAILGRSITGREDPQRLALRSLATVIETLTRGAKDNVVSLNA